MVASVQEENQFHGVLLARVEIIKVSLDLLDEVLQVLNPDVGLGIAINAVDVVSKDDSLSDIDLVTSELESIESLVIEEAVECISILL